MLKCSLVICLKVSLPDVSIGKTSITDLRAINNVEIQNEIRVLLPYLEVTSNHGYLIARLKTLASVCLCDLVFSTIHDFRVVIFLDTSGMVVNIMKEKNGAKMTFQPIRKF